MLSTEQINRIANEVATEHLPPGAVLNVTSEPEFGTDGEETRLVLVVLRATLRASVTGAQAIRALSALQDRLHAAGETRRASIEYATDEELATHGGF